VENLAATGIQPPDRPNPMQVLTIKQAEVVGTFTEVEWSHVLPTRSQLYY